MENSEKRYNVDVLGDLLKGGTHPCSISIYIRSHLEA